MRNLRTIDFTDALVRKLCEQYLSGQYLEAALLYPPGLVSSVPGQCLEPKPVEAGLVPVLVVEFPPGFHEALVECCFRFAVSDDNLLCDPLSGDSLGPLPEALERIGAAADGWVGGLVADMRRFVAERLDGVRTEAAEFGQCG